MTTKDSKQTSKKSEIKNSSESRTKVSIRTKVRAQKSSKFLKFPKISNQVLGLIFTVIACILFWLPYPYIQKIFMFKSQKFLSLHPTLLTGMFSLALVAILYIRGIFTLKKNSLTFVAFLVNLTLFATLFEIFISPSEEQATDSLLSTEKIAVLSFGASTLMFGGREVAKTIFYLLIVSLFFFRLKLVSDAMGIFGYLAFLLLISGLYLQESIAVNKLKTECRYLIKLQK